MFYPNKVSNLEKYYITYNKILCMGKSLKSYFGKMKMVWLKNNYLEQRKCSSNVQKCSNNESFKKIIRQKIKWCRKIKKYFKQENMFQEDSI